MKMKTATIKGLTVLGIGLAVFGLGAATPATADVWHDRGRVEAIRPLRIDLAVGPVRVETGCAPVVGVDHYRDHDWRWRRDHHYR